MQFNCKVAAFVEGVNTLVPGELLTLWDEGELELLLCGIRNKILLLTHNVELQWTCRCGSHSVVKKNFAFCEFI